MQTNAYPQLYELARERFSCRSYSNRPVERDTLRAVLDVARLAPSACNKQPWLFLIADSDDLRKAVTDSYQREWIKTAPEFIIACGLHSEAWHRSFDAGYYTHLRAH